MDTVNIISQTLCPAVAYAKISFRRVFIYVNEGRHSAYFDHSNVRRGSQHVLF